jgi:hypothetical protein
MKANSWSGHENRNFYQRKLMASKVDVIRLNLLAINRYFGGLPVNSRGRAFLMTLGLVGSRKAGSRGGAMNTTESTESCKTSSKPTRAGVPDFRYEINPSAQFTFHRRGRPASGVGGVKLVPGY